MSDQLTGEWLTYYKVASRFSHKAKAQDREDLLQDIMISLADVARNNGHKPLTEPAMYRIASVTVVHYWRAQYKLSNGLDCHNCSKAQRQKCRAADLYSECPKAIKLDYLSKPITDSEGNLTELGELIADDKAIDIVARLDARRVLQGFPRRIVQVGYKKYSGRKLDGKEQDYLDHWRKKNDQLKLAVF